MTTTDGEEQVASAPPELPPTYAESMNSSVPAYPQLSNNQPQQNIVYMPQQPSVAANERKL